VSTICIIVLYYIHQKIDISLWVTYRIIHYLAHISDYSRRLYYNIWRFT